VKVLKDTDHKRFQKEKLAFERASEVESSQKLYDSYFCLAKRSTKKGDGFFFLEGFEGNLETIWKDDYFKDWMLNIVHREALFKSVIVTYMALGSVGILHKNFHPTNVLYKRERNWAMYSFVSEPTLVV